MKKVFLYSSACLLLSLSLHAQPVTMSLRTLEKKKSRLPEKDPVITTAYKQLLKDADEALGFGPVSVMEKTNIPPSGDKHDYMSLAPYFWPDSSKPGGLPYMRKDGQTNPEVKNYKDKEYMPRLCHEVLNLSLAWYYSGKSVYAEHAVKLMRVWFIDTATRMNPNLQFAQAIKGVNDGRGAGLIDSRHLIQVVDAIGILKGSPFWSKANDQIMQKWFADFLNWMQTSKQGRDELNAGNNHGMWYDAQRLSFALYSNQTALAKDIVANVQKRLDQQMDTNGLFPAELVRTISLHYSVFVMEPLFLIARMAQTLGIDLWSYTSPKGNSLAKGMTALKPYLLKQKDWTGPQIKPFDYDEAIPLLAMAIKGLNCPDCKEGIRQAGGNKWNRDRVWLTIETE